MSSHISLERYSAIARSILIIALAAFSPLAALAKFDAILQGQSVGSTNWVQNNVQGWKELDLIPVRVYMTGGPATNQHIVVDFDHFKVVRPGIENLSSFRRSSNVVITAGPTLNAPLNSDLWSYRFTVALTDNKSGFVEFRARLAAGSHVNTGSSLHLSGDTALGTLQIHKPGPAAGVPDLVVIKKGPTNASAGETITYTLNYSNKMSAAVGATGVQVTDVLPPSVTYVPNSSAGATLVGNILSWDLGKLARGASGAVSFRVTVKGGVTNGQAIENNAAIYSAENDANLNDNVSKLITRIRLNRAPTVSITMPTNGTVFVAPADITIIAEPKDIDGTITNVTFFQSTNTLGESVEEPYLIVWKNVSAGNYQLRATATDNLGARGTSAVVNITVLAHPIMVAGAIIFNRQTGLFEQAVRITNPSPLAFSAVRVPIRNLPAGMRVWNASGYVDGVPYVQYNFPVAPGETMPLMIEYYDPNRTAPNPTLAAELTDPAPLPNPTGVSIQITRKMVLPNGTFLLEFNSLTNRTYYVQYSDDSDRWKTALPPITGTGTRAQWIDNGPPRTQSPPSIQSSRMYRLIMAP